jgi:integrase
MREAVPKKIDLEPLELWEYVAIHPHLSTHYQLIYRVLWETGIRIQECLNLSKKDKRTGTPDLEKGGIWVNRLKKKKGTPVQRDFIPIPAALYQALLKWQATCRGNQLFPITTQCAWKALKKAARTAGVRESIHPHLFRHAFGRKVVNTNLGLSELNERVMLAKMLGHSGTKYVERYINPSKAEVQDVFRRLGGAPK